MSCGDGEFVSSADAVMNGTKRTREHDIPATILIARAGETENPECGMLKFMFSLPFIALPQRQSILPQRNDKRCRKTSASPGVLEDDCITGFSGDYL